MLPRVKYIRVYTLDPDSITVEWGFDSTTLDLSTYLVQIWRSESQGGPYEPVSPSINAADTFLFQDGGTNLYSKWRNHFYRVRVINGGDPSEYQDFGETPYQQVLNGADPGGVGLDAPPDLLAAEATRRFNLVLREYAGRRVLVLPVRTWGQYCPACWDHLKRRPRISNCVSCMGTNFVGGFFRPIEAFSMKPPHDVTVQLTSLFKLEADDRVMWFSRFPELKPGDVVLNTEGERHRVVRVGRSEKASALTRQTVQVRHLSRDQVEYKIPINASDWGRDNLTAGAIREHIRAQDIESYYTAVGQLGVESVEIFPTTGEIATNLEDSNG